MIQLRITKYNTQASVHYKDDIPVLYSPALLGEDLWLIRGPQPPLIRKIF